MAAQGSSYTLAPTSLAFGKRVLNLTSSAKTITLNSNGSAALPITSIAISGTDLTQFTQTNNCGSSVPAGNRCTISVGAADHVDHPWRRQSRPVREDQYLFSSGAGEWQLHSECSVQADCDGHQVSDPEGHPGRRRVCQVSHAQRNRNMSAAWHGAVDTGSRNEGFPKLTDRIVAITLRASTWATGPPHATENTVNSPPASAYGLRNRLHAGPPV